MERLSGQTLADVIARGTAAAATGAVDPRRRAVGAGNRPRGRRPASRYQACEHLVLALGSREGGRLRHREERRQRPYGDGRNRRHHGISRPLIGSRADPHPSATTCTRSASWATKRSSGRRPFPQENLAELARAVAIDTPPPLAVLRRDVDPALAAVIERAMARDPAWRFASADEMRAALVGRVDPPVRPATARNGGPATGRDDDGGGSVVRRSRSSRWLWGVVAVLIALVVSVIAIVVDSTSRPAGPEPASTSTSVAPPPTPAVRTAAAAIARRSRWNTPSRRSTAKTEMATAARRWRRRVGGLSGEQRHRDADRHFSSIGLLVRADSRRPTRKCGTPPSAMRKS